MPDDVNLSKLCGGCRGLFGDLSTGGPTAISVVSAPRTLSPGDYRRLDFRYVRERSRGVTSPLVPATTTIDNYAFVAELTHDGTTDTFELSPLRDSDLFIMTSPNFTSGMSRSLCTQLNDAGPSEVDMTLTCIQKATGKHVLLLADTDFNQSDGDSPDSYTIFYSQTHMPLTSDASCPRFLRSDWDDHRHFYEPLDTSGKPSIEPRLEFEDYTCHLEFCFWVHHNQRNHLNPSGWMFEDPLILVLERYLPWD